MLLVVEEGRQDRDRRSSTSLFNQIRFTTIAGIWVASYPGSRLIKCVGEEESLVSTALRFKPDPRHS